MGTDLSLSPNIRPMRLIILIVILGLASCTRQVPPCTYLEQPQQAASAGCFAMKDGDVLVVENLQGLVNLPGGSSKEGEAARCTAHRETWEETGLNLEVGELLMVMDTGFHLYHCGFTADSGTIDPPPRLEIRRAYLLSPAAFKDQEWRFPGDEIVLQKLAEQH